MTRLLLTFSFTVTILLSHLSAQYDFDVDKIPDSLTFKANSVIRHSHVNIEMFEEEMVYSYDYAITALNKKHENELLFMANYGKNESKIKDVKIKIYDADGQLVKKIKSKEIKEYGIQDIEFADDTRSMIYEYSSPVFPVTMHVTYRHEVESPYYLRSWYPISEFKQAVEVSSIKITDHVGGSYDFQAYDLPEPILQDSTIVHYEVKSQKALSKERYMPSKWQCLPRLKLSLKRLKYYDHVGTINDWNEYGIWTYNEMYLSKQDVDLSVLKAETSHLISSTDGDLQKAQKLYKYIQKNTRYIFISLEDGGWSPLAVSTVHNKKYGDCKALSFYYNSLCKAHGIEATLALVYAGAQKFSANKDFYSSSQFNHVISKLDIEDQTYWVDCTSKVDPFNYLGSFTDDRNVLLMNEKSGIIAKTPEYQNVHKTNTSMTFSADGKLEATIEMNTIGIGISRKLRQVPTLQNQELATYKKALLSKYSDPNIIDYSFTFDTTNLNFKETFQIVSDNAGEKLGEHYKIKLNRNEIEPPKLKRDKNRVWPVEFLRNKESEATTILKHDLSLVPMIEDDVSIDSEFGKYTYMTKASAGEVMIQRSLFINKATYDPEKYNEIKSFFDKVRKIENRSIILSSKS